MNIKKNKLNKNFNKKYKIFLDKREKKIIMDEVRYPVLTEKTIRLLEQNQYTFDVNQKSTKTQIKKWIESFFNVKVKTVNSHIPPERKKKIGPIIGHSVRYKRMIITLQSGYSIPLFSNK